MTLSEHAFRTIVDALENPQGFAVQCSSGLECKINDCYRGCSRISDLLYSIGSRVQTVYLNEEIRKSYFVIKPWMMFQNSSACISIIFDQKTPYALRGDIIGSIGLALGPKCRSVKEVVFNRTIELSVQNLRDLSVKFNQIKSLDGRLRCDSVEINDVHDIMKTFLSLKRLSIEEHDRITYDRQTPTEDPVCNASHILSFPSLHCIDFSMCRYANYTIHESYEYRDITISGHTIGDDEWSRLAKACASIERLHMVQKDNNRTARMLLDTPALRYLRVHGDYMKSNSQISGFPQLVHLKWVVMSITIVDWNCLTTAYPGLQSIYLMDCKVTQHIHTSHTPQLRYLRIYYCDMTDIINIRSVHGFEILRILYNNDSQQLLVAVMRDLLCHPLLLTSCQLHIRRADPNYQQDIFTKQGSRVVLFIRRVIAMMITLDGIILGGRDPPKPILRLAGQRKPIS